jgi:hypothetical protein
MEQQLSTSKLGVRELQRNLLGEFLDGIERITGQRIGGRMRGGRAS